MRKESKKKKWSRPQLIILTRGKPEERVLTSCKTGQNVAPGGPVDTQFACLAQFCEQCYDVMAS